MEMSVSRSNYINRDGEVVANLQAIFLLDEIPDSWEYRKVIPSRSGYRSDG